MVTAKLIIIAFVIFILLDLVWFKVFMGTFTKEQLGTLIRKSGGEITPHIPSALIVYVFLALGFVFFIVPKAHTAIDAMLWGVFLNAVIYGVYEFTNFTLLAKWTVPFLIADMLGGMASGGIAGYLLFVIKKWL